MDIKLCQNMQLHKNSYVSEYGKMDLMAQKTFIELLITSYSMIFEL